MTKVRFTDAIAFVLCLIPFVAWYALRDSLPERLPIHWNAEGEVNGWTSKDNLPFFILLMTAISAGTYVLLRFIKQIDPKQKAQLNEGIALKIGIGIIVFMTAINLLILLPKSDSFNITTVMLVMVSLLFTFTGNLMYNIKPNYLIGIRLPWTLENEYNWKQTHRLAGIIWFIGGIISAILAFILTPKVMFPIFIAITIILVLVPSVYSFVIFKRTKKSSSDS